MISSCIYQALKILFLFSMGFTRSVLSSRYCGSFFVTSERFFFIYSSSCTISCIIGIEAQKTLKTDLIRSLVWLYPQREIIPLGGLSSLAGRKCCYYFVLSLCSGRQAVTFQPVSQANCINDEKCQNFKGKSV